MWILPKNLPSLASAQVTEDLNLDSEELASLCEQSLLVRSKPTPQRTWLRKWKRDSWTHFLFGRTLRLSRAESFADWWTSLLAGTLVSHFQPQENDREPTTLDTYGHSLETPYGTCNQGYVSSRTSTDMSPSDCGKSLPTWLTSDTEWKTAVKNQRGEYLARKKSALLTPERESSFWQRWATPRASDGDKGGPNQRGSKGDQMLPSQVMWRTPNAQSVNSLRGAGQNPEIRKAQGRQVNLQDQIVGLQDQENSNTNGKSRAQLNADWVEQLMGIPVGWTDCAYVETESSPQPPKKHGELSGSGV